MTALLWVLGAAAGCAQAPELAQPAAESEPIQPDCGPATEPAAAESAAEPTVPPVVDEVQIESADRLPGAPPDASTPDTSTSDTSTPETSASATSASDTSTPDTSAPATSASATSAPDTSIPDTTTSTPTEPQTELHADDTTDATMDVNEGPLEAPVARQDETDPPAPANAKAEPETFVEGPPPPDASPMEVCAAGPKGDMTVLYRVRRSLTVTACASSAWLDGLFGDQIHYDDYHATHGTVALGGLWSDYDGFDPRLRFRVRLQLPQWDERVSAFAGRVGEDDYISDTEDDFDALPTRQFGNLEDESVLLGLGYSNPDKTGNDFDAGVGVRVDVPLDPYARARYEVVRAFAERYVFNVRETVFWQNTEGFGTTTRMDLDRVISDRFLLRWSNLGKYTEETVGVQWYTQMTLFQSIGQRTGLAWQAQVEGATDNEVQLTRHSMRLIMRRQLTPDWLILELRGGVSWPRRKLEEKREASPEVGIAVEMQFGRKPSR